ncbi:MAG: zf-HC2 domain-containing protein [Candidatus Poribacteria bacterium]|nr:zf-HC2 domain-containing protein [Candidatus Poribacteria bacterium]
MTQSLSHGSTCANLQTLLEEYIVGELDSQTESAITSHLTTCERCQHELHLAQTINKVLGDLPKHTSPPEILREVTAYIRANPNNESWIHRFFQFTTVMAFLRTPLMRASVVVTLIGIMLFGIHQYQRYVQVEQAKSDFHYAMAKMQSAVRKTSLAVNDTFTSLNVDEAPRRALKPTANISSAFHQSLSILYHLTDSDNSENTDTITTKTKQSKSNSEKLNTLNPGGNTQ